MMLYVCLSDLLRANGRNYIVLESHLLLLISGAVKERHGVGPDTGISSL